MKRFFLVSFSLLLSASAAFAAPYFWIGGAAGSWNSAANWSATSNGAAGTLTPGANDDVTFDNGLTIDLTYNAATNSIGFRTFTVINNTQLILNNTIAVTRSFGINNSFGTSYEVVQAGSSLTLRSVNNIFEFATINGRCIFNGDVKCIVTSVNTSNGPRLQATSDTIEINALAYLGDNGANLPTISPSNFTGPRFRWKNTGTYQHDRRAGSVPGGTFDPNSLIKITGARDAGPSLFATPGSAGFGSLEWNSPNQTITVNPSLSTGTIFQGFFKVINTGTSVFRPATTPSITVRGDLIVEGGTLNMGNSASVATWNLNGRLLQTGGVIDLQASSGTTTINLRGDLSQNTAGSITETGSNVSSSIDLVGTIQQKISLLTAGLVNDITLKLNNAAGAVGLTDINLPATGNAKLTLTTGNIDMLTNNKILFVQNPQSNAVVGGTAASHVIGRLKRNSTAAAGYSFPVSNNATDLKRATVTTASIAATTWEVQFIPTNANSAAVPVLTNGDQIDIVSPYIWDIQRVSGTSDATNVTLSYTFTGNGVLNPANAKVVHWNNAAWESFGGTDAGGSIDNTKGTDGNVGTVISNFSPFTFGGAAGVLPISIEYFRGSKQASSNVLDWKVTCTTQPTVNLSVERSSDGRNFSTVYNLTATAARCNEAFSYTDTKPLAGANYYRLKTISPDAELKYSSVVLLMNKSISGINLTPNPVTDFTVLSVASTNAGKVSVSVRDFAGKLISTGSAALIAGNNQLPMSFATLAAGTYIVTVTTDAGETISSRFVKK